MSLKDIQLKKTYTTYHENVIKEFYEPVLSNSTKYYRSVGFFTSSALMDQVKGIREYEKNKQQSMFFIVSPYLNEEDIVAIEKGYKYREIAEKALLRNFEEPKNYYEQERLNLIAHLIEDGTLDIKVAFTKDYRTSGMFHEKVGIAEDEEKNSIAFVGSMNESHNAFHNNYESFVVFKSWENTEDYIIELKSKFLELWNNQTTGIEIIEFPRVIIDKIYKYKTETVDLLFEDKAICENKKNKSDVKRELIPGIPTIPDSFIFRDYQLEAIDNWRKNDYCGIFDMATGTGKTFTGLGAITRLFEEKERLAIIIVCPYQHLVEQWVEDIVKFNMYPIIGYSASIQKNWKDKLKETIFDFNLKTISSFCFITTNATFSSDYIKKQMAKIKGEVLLVVDEAHNFGAPNLQKTLVSNFKYRLALSATFERHGDPEGTEILRKFFGQICISYDIERAIKEGKLTPYKYYPILVFLTEGESKAYNDLSYRISKEIREDKTGKYILSEKGKMLLIQRARLLAGAFNKLEELKKAIIPYKNENQILVYCGATKVNQDIETDTSDSFGERQIQNVSQILGNDLGMKVTHFTSNETAKERKEIIRSFQDSDPYQTLIAIKCLDEGVNIPSIKTAFILASTTNPKEYIQRRGRVLRLYKNKLFAEIYDFVTLLKKPDDVSTTDSDFGYGKNLAKRELQRVKDFGRLAINSNETYKLIDKLESIYSFENDNIGEEIEDI